MITVNLHEAKTRLSELVKAVEERNETVVLCRDGREVAEIRRTARFVISPRTRAFGWKWRPATTPRSLWAKPGGRTRCDDRSARHLRACWRRHTLNCRRRRRYAAEGARVGPQKAQTKLQLRVVSKANECFKCHHVHQPRMNQVLCKRT